MRASAHEGATTPLSVGAVLRGAWTVYRRDLLLVLPALVVARGSVVLAATLLVEVPITALHLLGDDTVEAVGGSWRAELAASAVMATLYASLGHHFLQGVLERVVAADRHGHEAPTLRSTFSGLPWGRLIIADVVLSVALLVLLLAMVIPRLVLGPFLLAVMPLLSMRHENLRTVWRASWRLVRGSWLPAAICLAVAVGAQLVVVEGAAALAHALTHDHTTESLVHGLAAVVVVPFAALVPVVATFELLDLHSEVPEERY